MGILSNIVDDSTCSILLNLTQNVLDTRTAENLVTWHTMMSRQTPTAMCLHVWELPKKQTVAWFNILWKLQKHMNSLPILPNTLMSCSWVGATVGYQLHSISSASELCLLHWLDLQKEQNSPLKWSKAVKNSCARHYILDGSTLPMWKRYGYTFKLLRHELWFNKLPHTHGAWLERLEYTRQAHIQANVWSRDVVLDPIIPNLWSLDSTKMVANCCQCKPRKHQLQNSVLVQFCSCALKNLSNVGACQCSLSVATW